MKFPFKINQIHIFAFSFIVTSIVIYYYKYEYVEPFQGNTVNTLLNLPSWIIYSLMAFLMIMALLSMYIQFMPWMYGIKTAGNLGGRAINGYFGKRNAIVPVKPVNVTQNK